MLDSYSYILAELLKRNTQLHGEALHKRGQRVTWPSVAIKTINKELQAHPLRSDTKLKAISGDVWGWLRRQDLTTRHIYQLLLQWALYLTAGKLLCTYTDDYAAVLEELRNTIETGAEGRVEDIDANEILQEWEYVQEQYYSLLHNLCTKLIEGKNQ